ncbi:PucR family transcriptional regulator [Cellulosilyticum sp. ST5]|uniref:PucR family transcriptional regulator n=1 Tax=Cellulosilyticum sp. ST5 TaxID=3055805 RepID=UPI0039775F5C
MEDEKSFLCRDLMNLKCLKGIKLVAGEKHLDHIVTRVNIMEVPDIANWAQPNEFLITTGYAFQDHEEAFIELIPKLKRKGIAAFGIKPKRFIKDISQDIIEVAETCEMPLFILPPNTVFSNVVREVMEKICAKEMSSYSIIQGRLEVISKQLLKNDSLADILENISGLINNPIAVVVNDNDLFCSSEDEKRFEGIIALLQERDADQTKMTCKMSDGNTRVIYTFPIENAVIVLLEQNQVVSTVDRLTITTIQSLIAIKLHSDTMYNEVRARYIDNFIQDWLGGYIHDVEELDMQGLSYGYQGISTMKARVAIIHMNLRKSGLLDRELIYQLNEKAGRNRMMMFTEVTRNITAILLYKEESQEAYEASVAELKAIVEKGCNTQNYTIYIGRLCRNTIKIREQYLDTVNLMKAGSTYRDKENVVTWDKIGIYSILTLIPKHKNVEDFLEKYVQPILEYDSKKNLNLYETVETYFKAHCNVKMTAELLYTHYNTIVYRLDKVKGLLGIDFDDYDSKLNVEIALKLYRIYSD